MRRHITIKTLLLTMVLFAMIMCAGCRADSDPGSGGDADDAARTGAEGPKIVTTIFPIYDWTMNILGDDPAGAEVYLLMDSGVDLHSYQPTTEDMMKISECDLLIYIGGPSDAWVTDALAEAVNRDMIALDLLDVLGTDVKKEAGDEEIDEHIWLSLKNAARLCESIEEALAEVDPDNADTYAADLEAYLDRIGELDASYRKAVADAPLKTLLFGDRFPFRYMTDDYGLEHYAAFDGCSAETEASFETIRSLSSKMDELGLPCVMTIDGSDQTIAETIISNTKEKDQKILALNSMQSVTADDTKAGVSYLSIMEENLAVLKEALQRER